jgi:hypothetical protein
VRKAARSRIEPELWFEDILVLAKMIPAEYLVARISADSDDDKGRAALIVSGDPGVLEIGEHEGVRLVTPRTFLVLLARP